MNPQGRYNKTINLHYGSYKSPHLKSIKQALADCDQVQRLKWCRQLIFKLNLIHSTHVHSSLNVESLKVDANDNLVIIDSQVDQQHETKSFCDLKYVAPENLLHNSCNSKPADIWAAGICICFINTNRFPWRTASISDNNFEVWFKTGMLEDVDDEFCMRVLKCMLCTDSNERQTLKKTIKKLFQIPPNFEVVG